MNGYAWNQNGHRAETPGDTMEDIGYKVFNDSVHGHISLHPLLVKVVDTPEFQRLRNLKQLGVAYYVFPGAGHCRFEHSLGTCYLAGQLVTRLLKQEKQQRSPEQTLRLTLCVQLAALCHDLGHGPFSHTWETVAHEWGSWMHERGSIALFEYLIEKNQLMEEFNHYGLSVKDILFIKQLIMGGPVANETLDEDNFFYEIVSNSVSGIDVDKWDYFLRDGLHLNLRITFDYRRMLEFCMVLLGEDGKTHIAFRGKEIMSLYDMYRVRYDLFRKAYRHPVVLNIELMIIDAFKAAGEKDYKINNSEILLKEAHMNPASLSMLTDHLFYDILYSTDASLETARTLFTRVLTRKLYTLVGSISIPLQKNISREKQKLLTRLNDEFKGALEFRIAEVYRDKHDYDPISKVTFYKKNKKTNEASVETFADVKKAMGHFPFQLIQETTTKLMIICTENKLNDKLLKVAQRIILDFEKSL